MTVQVSTKADEWLSALLFLLLLFSGIPVMGNDTGRNGTIALTLTDCHHVARSEVWRILHLELHSITNEHPPQTRSTGLHISCASKYVVIAVTDETAKDVLTREMPVNGQRAAGTERVLAIAAAELILSLWERQSNQASPASPSTERQGGTDNPVNSDNGNATSQVKDTPKSKQLSTNRPPRTGTDNISTPGKVSFHISGVGRLFTSGRTLLYGGEVGGRVQLPGPFELQLSIGAEGGMARRDIGTVSIFFADTAIMLGVHGMTAAGYLQGGIQMGLRGGYGRLNGKPSQATAIGNRLVGSMIGPLVRVSMASVTHPAFGCTVETGYGWGGISGRVEDSTDVALRGLWLMAAIDLWLR